MEKAELIGYVVIVETTPHDLEQSVLGLAREGWVPQGGVSIDGSTMMGVASYAQAMVRYRKR